MIQWHKILWQVLEHGEKREDRTGVGTLSVFGTNCKFDLREGFPAVTTKKLYFGQVAAELAAFLAGAETLEEFHKFGCTLWDANALDQRWVESGARFDGDLGPIYGSMWRKWPVPTVRDQPLAKLRDGLEATFAGVANGQGSADHPLRKTWQGMITRCYDRTANNYHFYGGRGVFVCNEWLEFAAFCRDAVELPGWNDKARDFHGYQLDKDSRGDGFRYSPTHCAWISLSENQAQRYSAEYTVENKEGEVFSFTNASQFCREHNCEIANFTDLWTGRKNAKTRDGFKLINVRELRPNHIDQLAELIKCLREDPFSRRHLVTAWNPGSLSQMALPPCHIFFQCYVSADRQFLDLRFDLRSVDLFVGWPFDVASYALLAHLLARDTGLVPRWLSVTMGDAHVYLNHLEQAAEVLSREPMRPPVLRLTGDVGALSFRPDCASLAEYASHPAVRAKMNV
jgi:thymidylate synthase